MANLKTIQQNNLNELKVSDLKRILFDNDLPTHGKKKHLVNRLKIFFKENPSKGKDEPNQGSSASQASPSPPKTSEQKSVHAPRETTSSSTATVEKSVSSFSFRYPVLLEDTKEGAATLSGLGILSKNFWISTIGPIIGQKQLSSGKWLIGCTSVDQQSSLLHSNNLAGITIKCQIPEVVTEGVIKPVPIETDLNDIQKEHSNVKQLLRLKNKDGSDSRAVKITFLESSLPKNVTFGYQSFTVSPYVPQVYRCTRCNRLGHTKTKCRSKQVCGRCGLPGHDIKNCSHTKKCVNCQGNHSSSYQGCPEFKLRVIAGRIKSSSHMSFTEAIALARKQNQKENACSQSHSPISHAIDSHPVSTVMPTYSYSDVVSNNKNSSSVIAVKSPSSDVRTSENPGPSSRSKSSIVTDRQTSLKQTSSNKSSSSQPHACTSQSTTSHTPPDSSNQTPKSNSNLSSLDHASSFNSQTESSQTPQHSTDSCSDSDKISGKGPRKSVYPVPKNSTDFMIGTVVMFLENITYQLVSIMNNITEVMTSSISELKSIISRFQENF